ncbi:hypothetical protein O181_065883 [Austropuccinia psidii MF-1]|uniref:Uncharacterized protein n=1 Tax=Austropuccinia psidii MF-1 TaxID=1389203 RepID=A0A9Q3EW48_9BASI|nr:hypothetical protein [Austropuccinia psidii MF-1]
MAQKGYLRPRPPNEKGWLVGPEPPRKQKDTPRPKNKDEDLGVGDMEELAREAKDGRIWPEAIIGQGRVLCQKAIEHQRRQIGHKDMV